MGVVMGFLHNHTINMSARKLFNLMSFDYKEAFVPMLRGFKPKENFLDTFRIKPSACLLHLLMYRVANYDTMAHDEGTEKIMNAQHYLVDNGIFVPGQDNKNRDFWLFPIVVSDVPIAYKSLNLRGVDVYQGATQLKPILPPVGARYKEAPVAANLFDMVVYLPIIKDMPEKDMLKICKEATEVVSRIEKLKQLEGSRAKL